VFERFREKWIGSIQNPSISTVLWFSTEPISIYSALTPSNLREKLHIMT